MSIKILSAVVLVFISLTSLSQQLEKMILENWTNGEWVNRMRELPYYDESGRLMRNEMALWSSDSKQWMDQTKTEFHRDENGVLLRKETFKWNPEMTSWEPNLRLSYSVNENNQPREVLTESYGENGWSNQSIEEFEYDATGNVIEKTLSKWDNVAFSWTPSQTIEYRFVENRKAGYTIRVWNNTVNDWQFYKQATFFYSESGIADYILYESWIDNAWSECSRRNNLLGESGKIKSIEVELMKNELWEKSSHVDYELTDFGRISSSTSKSWLTASFEWENLQRSTYYYSETGKMVSEWESQQELELFPNPALEHLTIRALPQGKLTVHDALSKIVYQTENVANELQLNVSNWEMGTYSIQIDGREVQQFLKQ